MLKLMTTKLLTRAVLLATTISMTVTTLPISAFAQGYNQPPPASSGPPDYNDHGPSPSDSGNGPPPDYNNGGPPPDYNNGGPPPDDDNGPPPDYNSQGP